jgi:hypothetical protein
MSRILVFVVLAAQLGHADRPPPGVIAYIDRRVAVAGRDSVWQSELDERLEQQRITSATSEQRALALGTLIDDKLIDRAAEDARIEISDAEVDRAIAELKATNHFDAAGFAAELARSNLTVDALRADIGRQLRASRYFLVAVGPFITEDEIRRAYAAAKAVNPQIQPIEQLHASLYEKLRNERLPATRAAWLKARRLEVHIEEMP